jgi:galactokinase
LGSTSVRIVWRTNTALADLPDERLRRRTRHVVTEVARVDAAVGCLERGDVADLGELFLASHASLRDDFEVSCEELDLVVETAREHGALGARMTGGGFGGSAIVLVGEDRLTAVEEAVAAAFAERGLRTPGVLHGTPGPGARRLA